MPDPSSHWISGLLTPSAYGHPVQTIQLMETHISWVILTGSLAYKIKKPVSLGFVDFSTLERRRFFCHEELRLNRRLAPEFYLRVVPVTGTPQQLRMNGSGMIIDYAVCMRQFDTEQLLSQLARRSELRAEHLDQLADLVGRFHNEATRAQPDSPHASLQNVIQPALDNFRDIAPLADPRERPLLTELESWTRRESERLQPVFQQRADGRMIRECHGDMHLGNMFVTPAGRVVVFDGIEFNDRFRWIDIISEVAFTMMDLEDRGYSRLAWRYLNRWLETTGDFAGLSLLTFYRVYRAMVRAKVDLIRSHQAGAAADEQKALNQESRGYLELAHNGLCPPRPFLAITCGPSGSGKTTLTQSLIESLGMIRLRSDVERKRLAGLSPQSDSGSTPGGGLYSAKHSAAVYQRLACLSEQLLEAGFPVLVDATFLKHADRAAFAALAERRQVPFLILTFDAPAEVLRQRVRARQQQGGDASEATEQIVDLQLQIQEPLDTTERSHALDGHSDSLVSDVRSKGNGP